MQAIKETAVAVCAMMMVCSLVSMLAPGEKFERIMKTLLASAMLVTIVSGLSGVDLSFSLESFDTAAKPEQSEFSGKVIDYAKGSVESVSRRMLEQQLEQSGIECKNIEFDINISEQGSISIDRVTLEIPNSVLHGEAKRIAQQVLGEGTDTVIIGK